MFKKFGCIALIIATLLSLCVLNVTANTESKTIKKIVSIVYDDSGSMKNKNEDWAYASYSLQNMIGLMNSQDELSVVRMSKPAQTVSIDLSTNNSRTDGIKSVEKWGAPGLTTPFSAVETAVNWLKSRKSNYADSQSVEFWLVIITDGAFETGYPTNMTDYLNELKDSMGNSKFEGVFVAIGKKVPNYVKNDWTSATGNHWIPAANSDDIVNAMSRVSNIIMGQGGENSGINITASPDGKGVTFTSSFPLKKFIVYQQNQSVGISSISVNGTSVETTADFTANKPGKGSLASRTIHCESSSSDYIPAGKITVRFDSKIDVSNNNFKILTDSAVTVDFKVLDKAGKEIKDLDKSGLVEGDIVEFAAKVTSSADNKAINLKNWANEISAQLIVNDQIIDMEYNPNDNTFYGTFKIESGSNLAYSVITLPGYFRAKSNVINLYPIEVIENTSSNVSSSIIDVPYKYCTVFEEIGAFTYTISGGNINGICNFEFKNMPKGITASVNGIFADKNGKLSVKIRNDIPADVKFYRNKDYKETEKSTIEVKVSSNQYVLNWAKDSITKIVLNPVKRNLTLETVKTTDADNLNLNNFDGTAIYIVSVRDDNEYLSSDELETLKLKCDGLSGIKFKTKVIEYNGKYAIQISCNKTSPALFVKTGDITRKITFSTMYGEMSNSTELAFYIKDSVTKYIIPLLLIVLIAVLIGYLPGIKKRIPNKKYHIQANGESEAIYVKTITRLLPYVTEKGSGSDLSLIATSNNNKICVVNDFYAEQKITLDGDPIGEGKSKFDLPIESELKIIEQNRETVYIYCDSRNDDTFDNDFDYLDDTDDLFGDNTSTANASDSSNDDFFS